MTNSLSGGGAERAMNILANELHRIGHTVSLVAINHSKPDLVTPDCSVITLEREWRGTLKSSIKSFIGFQKAIWKISPHLTILNCDLPEFFGALAHLNSRVIVVEHANAPWSTRLILGRVTRKLLKLKKTEWVAVSDKLSIWPNRSIPSRIIPNPIADLEVTKFPTVSLISRLVFVGRLTHLKNPEGFIEIAKLCSLPVLIIGDGEDRESLIAKCIDLKIESDFQGWVSNPWELMKKTDLLVIPSRSEGDGLVVIEAILRNIPLIIADIPEFRRFNFPDVNYASEVTDFSASITGNFMNASIFQVNSVITHEIAKHRDIENIARSWEDLFREMNLPK